MSSFRCLVFLLSILLFLFSCQQNSNSVGEGESERSFSESYKAPVFDNDNRKEYIEALAPSIQKLIEEHAEERKIPGVVYGITVDDELIVSGASGLININKNIPPDSRSSFRIASMTKSFTAMAIMKLKEEGKLSLSDPADKYIPEMSGLEYLTLDAPTITIENLLTMTAGFPEDNPWGDRQLDESDEMLMKLMAEGVAFSNPSSYRFEYSNTGYALLGNIISKVAEIPYGQYIAENIFEPLGMNETYWEIDSVPSEQLAIGYRWEDEKWQLEPMLHHGAYGSMGGLITSINDFSKYVSFHLSAWPPRNDEDLGPVKRSSLRAMHNPKFNSLAASAKNFLGEDCPLIGGYGYGLGIRKDCNGLLWISHGGALPGFGSNYVFFPEYGIGLMAFGNLTYTSPWPLNKMLKLLFEDGELETRKLPVSNVLASRKDEVHEFIMMDWESTSKDDIFAENFYMDMSKELRIKEFQEILAKAGDITSVDEITPFNQLRGNYKIQAENGFIDVYFTLSPEKDPKVQQLDFYFGEN